MKRISIVLSLSVLMAWPAMAVTSIEFSTTPGADFSWELTNVGGTWQLSFLSTATEVDDSEPTDPVLEGDFVNLPTMTVTNISSPLPGIVTATLTPVGDLTIQADADASVVAADTTVLAASVGVGTLLTNGTTYGAYSSVNDDLDILSFVSDYGVAIPQIAGEELSGFLVDMSFSGTSQTDLRSVLLGVDPAATANGNLAGTIVSVIPAPGSLLLAALGTIVAGWLRQRKLFA